jgi:hypothetical protein
MPKLEDFYNIHNGKAGIVIGAGPSISDIDKKLILKHPNIAVNSSILLDPSVKYWISDDIAVSNWSYFYKELKNSSCCKFMYRSKLGVFDKFFGADKTVMFDHDWWYQPSTGRKNLDGVLIKRNSFEKIIGARTSSGSAIHILAIMGCDPIILCGMDNGVKNDKRYFWEGSVNVNRVDGKPNRGVWDKFDYNGVLEYFSDLYNQNKDTVNIFDATPGNPMGIFPSIDLEKL